MSESEIAAKIVEVLSSKPERRMRGTELAAVLKDTCGYSSAVHGKLREFVDTHAPAVERVSRAGMDWVYGLKSCPAEGEAPTDNLRNEAVAASGSSETPATTQKRPEIKRHVPATFWKVDPKVWKTFVSPSAVFTLFGSRDTGELLVLPNGSLAPAGPWDQISSCTADDHVRAASDWLKTVSDSAVRQQLETALQNGTGPQSEFFATVERCGLAQRWNSFRTKRLLGMLERRLAELGIPKRNAVVSQRATTESPASNGTGISKRHVLSIATAALGRMTNNEIRNLPIPLGHVLDVLDIH
jgi:hypothetical protein